MFAVAGGAVPGACGVTSMVGIGVAAAGSAQRKVRARGRPRILLNHVLQERSIAIANPFDMELARHLDQNLRVSDSHRDRAGEPRTVCLFLKPVAGRVEDPGPELVGRELHALLRWTLTLAGVGERQGLSTLDSDCGKVNFSSGREGSSAGSLTLTGARTLGYVTVLYC